LVLLLGCAGGARAADVQPTAHSAEAQGVVAFAKATALSLDGAQKAAPGQPDLRKVRAGEKRVEGLLQRIVCSPQRVEFVVKLPKGVARFRAASLDAVEFISYREKTAGNVECGGRTPPEHVYVTARPGPLDGTAVAVEFLPGR
jgi:hypothetical protein